MLNTTLTRLLLASCTLAVTLSGCKKDPESPVPVNSGNCTLSVIQSASFLGTIDDTIIYENGRISKINGSIQGQAYRKRLYVYESATSLKIYDLPLSGDSTGASYVRITLGANNRPVRVTQYPDNDLYTIEYTTNDSIRFYDNGISLVMTMHENAQGNIDYIRQEESAFFPLQEGYFQFDNLANPLKNLYYISPIDYFNWNNNNISQVMLYEDGVLTETVNYDRIYDNGRLTSLAVDGTPLLGFRYRCD